MAREKTVTDPVSLCCATIQDQDHGIAGQVVDAEIQKAIDDLMDRGKEDGKVRRVLVEIQLDLDEDKDVVSHVCAQAKLPPRRTRGTRCKVRMKAKGQHQLLFQADNPENPEQPHFTHEETDE